MNDDSSPWQYKPDGQTVSTQSDLPSSRNSAASKPIRAENNKAITWTASEYIDHTRGMSWYLALAGGTIVLAAGVYLITKDFFATSVIGIMGVIVGIFSTHKPKQVTYELSSSSLKAGEKVYPLSLFKSFALIHEGSLSSISLVPNKRFMPPLSIYLDPADEQKIVDMLGNHLPFEEGGLDTIERLSRRLRF
ncbi:hypothetical protein BVY00_00510 [bacterium G20]|nr:hypothetical protein BVY00_00510 [bacterium G20]